MRMADSRNVRQALKAFGLEEKEIAIYLAVLEFGAATVLQIARRVDLPRATIYPVIDALCRHGFLHIQKQKNRIHYIAEHPATFIKRTDENRRELEQVLPVLEGLHAASHDDVGVTMYEGTDGFRQFWQKLFRSGIKEYCLLTSGVGLREYVREDYLVKHVIAERLRLGIKSRQLLPDTTFTRKKIVAFDHKELRESRFLPRDVALPATTLIFGEQVAFITSRKENAVVLVASGDIAVTLKTAFELLWSASMQP